MKKLVIFVGLCIIVSFLFSEIILQHELPLTLKTDESMILDLEIVEGFSDLEKIIVYYREAGSSAFLEKEMEKGEETQPVISFRIEETMSYRSGLEYFFEVYDNQENITRLPLGESLYRLIPEKHTEYADMFVKLAPEAEISEPDDEYIIAISYFSVMDDIDKESIIFKFDGRDVTAQTEKYDNMLVYKSEKIETGKHEYQVIARLKDGTEIKSKIWSDDVIIPSFSMPLNISGRVWANTYLSSVKSDNTSDNDLKSDISLQLAGNHNWFHFNSKLYFSSLERRNKQPINRYYLSMRIPHLEINAGDKSPDFGSFSLKGKNIRGFHGNLNFKFFRLKASSGMNKRDTNTLFSSNAAFKRKTTAFRMEVGSRSGFNFGLSFTKNKDDIDSIADSLYLDAEENPVVTPNDNLILGVDTRLALKDQRFVWGTEAAMSLYNEDILDGAISSDSLEENYDVDLPIDPQDWENFFVLNENVQPLQPGMANLAYKTYLRAFFSRNLLNVSYSVIGSSFKSLSTNFLQNDTQIISIYDNLSLMKNRLLLNLGINFTTDNINDEKEYSTKSVNYFGQILYRPENLPYLKIGLNNNSNDTDANTSAVDIRSTNYTIGAGYNVENIEFAPTRFSLNYSNTRNKDFADETYDYKRNYISLNALSDFSDLPLETVLSYSFTANNDQSIDTTEKTNYHSIYMKGIVSLLQEKIKPYLDFKYTAFSGDIDTNAYQTVNLGSSYYLNEMTFFSTNIGLKMRQDDAAGNYSSFVWKFKVSRKF